MCEIRVGHPIPDQPVASRQGFIYVFSALKRASPSDDQDVVVDLVGVLRVTIAFDGSDGLLHFLV